MSMNLLSTAEVIDDHLPRRFALLSYVRRVSHQSRFRVIGTWIERSRQRRALANLDDRLLEDVAITRSAAAREIAQPFWR